MRSTGEIILIYLKKNSISQHLIAELIGVTPQYISNVVNNKKRPSKKMLKELIRILKISDTDLEYINNYEIYRRGYLIENNQESIKILGSFTNKGFVYDFSNKNIVINNSICNIDKMFYVYISTNILMPKFYKGNMIFFREIKNIKYNEKMYLIRYKNSVDIAYLEEISDKIIIRYIEEDKENYLLNKHEQKSLDIIGIYLGKLELDERI